MRPPAATLLPSASCRHPAADPTAEPVNSFVLPTRLQVCASQEEAENYKYGGAHGRGVQFFGEWDGEIVLQQGTFSNGQLIHGTQHTWFQSAPQDLPVVDWTRQWVHYFNRTTTESQREKCEYVLASIECFLDGCSRNIKYFVPDWS